MGQRAKGLLVGLLLGALAGGLAFGVWRWTRKPTYTAEQWMERLADEKLDAATELAALGDFGLEILLKARESDDIRIHRRAARGLSLMGEEAVPALVKALPRAGGRTEVILVAIGPPAIPALSEALGKDTAAPFAARVLGMMGERAEPARVALLGVLQDPKRDDKARAEAAWALGQLAPEEATRAVIAAAARFAARAVREQCFRALGNMGPAARPSAKALIVALDGKDEGLAELAAETLGRIGGTEAAPALAKLLDEKPSRVAFEALACVGTAKDAPRREWWPSFGARFVPRLIEELADPTTRVRALELLAEIGPPAAPAIPAIEALLASKDRKVRLAAALALLAITPDGHEKPAEALIGLLTPDAANGRETLSLGLAAVGSMNPLFIETTRHAVMFWHDQTPFQAAEALGRVAAPPPAVIEALRRGIKGGGLSRQCLSAAEQGGTAFRVLAPDVVAALKRPAVAEQAAWALASIAPDQAGPVPPLILDDWQHDLRRLERPPIEVLERIRGQLFLTIGGTFHLLVAYPREDLIELLPNIVEGLTRDHVGATELVRWIGPPALPFLRPMLGTLQIKAAATVLTDPRLKLPDADLDTVAKRIYDPEARLAAGAILAGQGARTTASKAAARSLLDHSEPELRALGAKALCVSKDDVPLLRECLFDPWPAVRAHAVSALGPEDARRALLDGDPPVRLEAARRLLSSEPDRAAAVAELLRLARGASPAGRAAIADMLSGEAAELVSLLEGDMRAGGLAAAAWLVRHAPVKADHAFGRLLAAVTRDGERAEAARLLGSLGPKAAKAVPWLKRQLGYGPTQMEREAMREAIKRIEG